SLGTPCRAASRRSRQRAAAIARRAKRSSSIFVLAGADRLPMLDDITGPLGLRAFPRHELEIRGHLAARNDVVVHRRRDGKRQMRLGPPRRGFDGAGVKLARLLE